MPPFDLQAFFHQFKYDEHNPLLFNNGFFVLFFAVFITFYFAFRKKIAVRRYIFCLFSLYFFYKASGDFVILVIISAIVDFVISTAIFREKKQSMKNFLLVLSIFFNLGVLFYFKYTNFFISLSNEFLHTSFNPLNWVLPIGISFYTFENLSYTIDVYRGQFVPARRFSDYLLFLSFFPKLMMGPIVRAHDFVPQINKPYVINESDFAKGFYLIISGLFKKLIISDYITLNFVNYIFDDPGRYTGLENLFAVYGFAAVIYCDFSGYSDIAIGIGRWLGFTIPPNFLSPYQSRNITEFWRRWHISLSSWLRDYLYIPLGGNRTDTFGTWFFPMVFFIAITLSAMNLLHLNWWQALSVSGGILLLFILPAIISWDKKGISTSMNILTTMLLGGFWHGASWTYIIWGALHGVGLGIHKVWMLITGKALGKTKKTWLYNIIMALLTFHFVCFTWIFFKAADFDTAMIMIYQIAHDFSFTFWMPFFKNYQTVLYIMALAYLLHIIPDKFPDYIIHRFKRVPMIAYLVIFFAFVLLYGYFKAAEPVMPIYLQF